MCGQSIEAARLVTTWVDIDGRDLSIAQDINVAVVDGPSVVSVPVVVHTRNAVQVGIVKDTDGPIDMLEVVETFDLG